MLSELIGITAADLSILETGTARAVRFSTLTAICDALDCQPGDLLRFEPGDRPAPRTERRGRTPAVRS